MPGSGVQEDLCLEQDNRAMLTGHAAEGQDVNRHTKGRCLLTRATTTTALLYKVKICLCLFVCNFGSVYVKITTEFLNKR